MVIESSEVLVRDVLEHNAGCFGFTAPDNLVELHNVGMLQQLSDKHFPFDFGFAYSSQNFDGYGSASNHVMSLKDVGISSPPDLLNDLEVFLFTEL